MVEVWLQYVVSILTGLAVTIPLVVKLVQYVQKAVQEKNWSRLLDMVMQYMGRAETMFEKGAERKEWVLAMIKSSADTINYNIDLDAVGALIDSLCDMSKAINKTAPTEKAA